MAYNTLIIVLCKKVEIDKVMDYLDVMIAKGVDPDAMTYCTLIEGLCKGG